ncbi:hypothetical protein J3Q09_14775 [Pseudomonas sp. R4-83]|uniref:hypothetical protein n=1 Tax=unclassified Pseudomonas TaxID=196821 RepID=UPI003DA86F31
MSSAAKRVDYTVDDEFTADLEGGSKFKALYTELTSGTTAGRGEVYNVIAYDRQYKYVRTFTIVFEKSKLDGSLPIKDADVDANVIYNDYEDAENPTLQKATSGTLTYTLDLENMQFTGSFTAEITNADANGTFPCSATFNTSLS